MRRIRWTPAAADDLEHIYAYLSQHRPELAAPTVRDLYDRIRALKTMPFIGHSGRIEGTREFVHPRMPYIVVYRVKPDAVEILHIHHSAQNWPRG